MDSVQAESGPGTPWSNRGLNRISGKGSVGSGSAPSLNSMRSLFSLAVNFSRQSCSSFWITLPDWRPSTRPTAWESVRDGPSVWTRQCRSRVLVQSRAAVSPGVALLETSNLASWISGSFSHQNRESKILFYFSTYFKNTLIKWRYPI